MTGFEEIFRIKSREEFARNPVSLTGHLIDRRFPKEDISVYRTMARMCPAVIAKVLRGDSTPEEAAAMAARQAKVDESAARSLFQRMCSEDEVEEKIPETIEEPAPAPERKPEPVPVKDEPVPPGLVLNVVGPEAIVLKYVGDGPDVRIPSRYKGKMVTSIEDEAFKKCPGLKTVEVPATVERIGRKAFEECKSLVRVDLPDSVERIGENAFLYCESLTSINIPKSLSSIEPLTFNLCCSLKSLRIPATVKSIATNAFRFC